MTEITAEQALKSKQNFTEYLADNTPAVITSTLAQYQSRSGKVVVTFTDLTQNIESLLKTVSDPTVVNLPQVPYLVWIVTNPKEQVMDLLKFMNKNSVNGFGVFVFKAFLNGDKIDFECLLKPELKEGTKRAKTITKTGEIQLDYWSAYAATCDEMGLGNFQVNPASQHYQNIPIGVKGAYIKQTISVKDNYVASEIFIGDDKKLYAKLEKHKPELEKKLGEMTWQCLDSNKSCNIRRTIFTDLKNKEKYPAIAKEHINLAVKMNDVFSKYM